MIVLGRSSLWLWMCCAAYVKWDTLPAKVKICRLLEYWLLWHRELPLEAWVPQTLEGEGLVGRLWAADVMEAVAGDLVWGPGGASVPEHHRCLLRVLATTNSYSHRRIQPRTEQHCSHDVGRTGAVSGAASAAAASAGGAAPADWRAQSRRPGPQSPQTLPRDRYGCHPQIYEDQTLRSFAAEAHCNSPRRDTLLKTKQNTACRFTCRRERLTG